MSRAWSAIFDPQQSSAKQLLTKTSTAVVQDEKNKIGTQTNQQIRAVLNVLDRRDAGGRPRMEFSSERFQAIVVQPLSLEDIELLPRSED